MKNKRIVRRRRVKPHRHVGKIVGIACVTSKSKRNPTRTFTLTVFTGVASFDEEFTEDRVTNLLPDDVDDPRWLQDKTCIYEYRDGQKRRIKALADGFGL